MPTSRKCQKLSASLSGGRSDSDMDIISTAENTDGKRKYVGRRLQMRFYIKDSCKHEWFNGKVIGFDANSGLHDVFFESDQQTIAVNLSQEEDDIIFYK